MQIKNSESQERIRFEFGMLERSPETENRWHRPAKFILALKDGSRVQAAGADYVLSEGDVLFVWPGEEVRKLSGPKSGLLTLSFSSSLITECDDICSVYHYFDTVRLLNRNSEDLREKTAALILEARESAEEEIRFHETRVRINILEILLIVAEQAEKNAAAALNTMILRRNSDSRMDKACRYIIAHCDSRITQAEAAETVGISTFYFSRLFSQYTGKSFNDFLNEHRVKKALMLLSNRRISIQDVAVNSGFQSISNFNKVFKKHVGCSPNEYRRIHAIREME